MPPGDICTHEICAFTTGDRDAPWGRHAFSIFGGEGENTIGKLNRWVILKSNFEVSGLVFSCIETKFFLFFVDEFWKSEKKKMEMKNENKYDTTRTVGNLQK